jgi:choline dehydrogenase-like flavoprotein
MKYATRHLVIAHCNINSNDSNGYFLTLKSNDVLVTRREYLDSSKRTIKLAAKAVSKFARKFNCFTLRPMIKDTISSGGYHVGGTMPMKSYPTEEIHTDLQGRPKNMKNVHVIDSSTFPSIPGTTIGLISMANATRIVSEVVK